MKSPPFSFAKIKSFIKSKSNDKKSSSGAQLEANERGDSRPELNPESVAEALADHLPSPSAHPTAQPALQLTGELDMGPISLASDAESVYSDPFGRDLLALRRRHYNRGYLDGVTNGSETGLQNGFDYAYPIGAHLGCLVGQLVVETRFRLNIGQISRELAARIYRELAIESIFDQKYYDVNLHLSNGNDHPIVAKWITHYKHIGSSFPSSYPFNFL